MEQNLSQKNMNKIIETKDDYKNALRRFEKIKHTKKGTCEDKELNELVRYISTYENNLYPIEVLSAFELEQILKEDFGHTKTSAQKILARLERKLDHPIR